MQMILQVLRTLVKRRMQKTLQMRKVKPNPAEPATKEVLGLRSSALAAKT